MRSRVRPAPPSVGFCARRPFFVQISDTHLFADPSRRLWSIAPDPLLDIAIDDVCALGERPEFVLVSGDCSGDGSVASYRRLASKLERIPAPKYYIPGNHDYANVMSEVLLGAAPPGKEKLVQTFETCGWRFVLLDSAVPDEDGGSIGDAQRAWLRETLTAHASTPTIVAVHHNPLPVGSRWLDAMTIADAGALVAILDTSPQVRAVLFGHVHQEFEVERGGTLYLGAPSTFFQFKPLSNDFAQDHLPGGVRVLRLGHNRVLSAVLRFSEQIDQREAM